MPRITIEFLGWTLDMNLDLTTNIDDEEEKESGEKLTTSEHGSVGFTADPVFRDLYPDDDED